MTSMMTSNAAHVGMQTERAHVQVEREQRKKVMDKYAVECDYMPFPVSGEYEKHAQDGGQEKTGQGEAG